MRARSMNPLRKQRRRTGRSATAAMLFVLAAWGGCDRASTAKEPLPEVNVSSFLPAIRQQIGDALLAARENPDDADIVGRLGMSLHAHEQYVAAESAYKRAEALAPQVFAWPYYLAMVQQTRGEADAALVSVARALSIDANHAPALHLKAELLIAKTRWDDAKPLVESILAANPVQARAHYTMGLVQQGLAQPEAAIESFEKACEFFPELWRRPLCRGRSLPPAGRPQSGSPAPARLRALQGLRRAGRRSSLGEGGRSEHGLVGALAPGDLF
ncbi:MAG: tetratricopeptide repeat protein [Bryobacterales bacterium]|nr:tetratricopeptide repeat protein [Bryobacterales bacterium]